MVRFGEHFTRRMHGKRQCVLGCVLPGLHPNRFTPNNDGVNDAFRIEGVEPRGFWLEIFNRWGDVVFYSEDPNEPGSATIKCSILTISFRTGYTFGACATKCVMDLD